MKKFVVSYTIPYRHDVSVGVIASDSIEAIHIAQAAFDNGTFWDDSEAMPLLHDDFEEVDDGNVFALKAEGIDGDFDRDSSVIHLRQQRKAIEACKALIVAYANGATAGGSIDWADVDAAHALALEAVPSTVQPKPTATASVWSMLEDFGDEELIEELYDEQPALREALITLIPGFEYPDWAARTIGDVRQMAR